MKWGSTVGVLRQLTAGVTRWKKTWNLLMGRGKTAVRSVDRGMSGLGRQDIYRYLVGKDSTASCRCRQDVWSIDLGPGVMCSEQTVEPISGFPCIDRSGSRKTQSTGVAGHHGTHVSSWLKKMHERGMPRQVAVSMDGWIPVLWSRNSVL